MIYCQAINKLSQAIQSRAVSLSATPTAVAVLLVECVLTCFWPNVSALRCVKLNPEDVTLRHAWTIVATYVSSNPGRESHVKMNYSSITL